MYEVARMKLSLRGVGYKSPESCYCVLIFGMGWIDLSTCDKSQLKLSIQNFSLYFLSFFNKIIIFRRKGFSLINLNHFLINLNGWFF